MKGRFLPELCEILEFLMLCENYIELKPIPKKNEVDLSSTSSSTSPSSDSSDDENSMDSPVACLSKLVFQLFFHYWFYLFSKT